MQNQLTITNDKKSIEYLKKYSEEIKHIHSDNTNHYTQSKEKQFYSYFKLDNRTRYFNTALNDNMSQTMYAYYFCDKSRQILSDKEATAIKAISLDNNYDMNDDNIMVANKYFRNNNDYDQV
jgi:UDP-N-acetylglucosamine:LPS N-acetylglucosamine transferase